MVSCNAIWPTFFFLFSFVGKQRWKKEYSCNVEFWLSESRRNEHELQSLYGSFYCFGAWSKFLGFEISMFFFCLMQHMMRRNWSDLFRDLWTCVLICARCRMWSCFYSASWSVESSSSSWPIWFADLKGRSVILVCMNSEIVVFKIGCVWHNVPLKSITMCGLHKSNRFVGSEIKSRFRKIIVVSHLQWQKRSSKIKYVSRAVDPWIRQNCFWLEWLSRALIGGGGPQVADMVLLMFPVMAVHVAVTGPFPRTHTGVSYCGIQPLLPIRRIESILPPSLFFAFMFLMRVVGHFSLFLPPLQHGLLFCILSATKPSSSSSTFTNIRGGKTNK